MENTHTTPVTRERMLLSKSAPAELAGAALEASAAAGLEAGRAAFLVVAVPGNLVAEAEELVNRALGEDVPAGA